MTNVVPLHDSLRATIGGLGDPARDKAAGVYYAQSHLTDEQLLNTYRSSWLARKIVDVPALDSIRKGRDWQAEGDQIEKLEAEEARLGLWGKLLDARVKARLWGGSALYIGTGDTNPALPLNPERVALGGLRYVTVLSRREIIAGELDQDALSETYGRPASYQVSGNGRLAMVHPSRLVIFIGSPHPDPWLSFGPNRGWGDSALQSVMSAVQNADSTAANIASLVFEANVDVFGIEGLMDQVMHPEFRTQLMTRFTLAAANKGINRSLIRDKQEEYDRKQISFANLPEVLQEFLISVAGASDIPATRLLGRSPAGMNATGDSDIRLYYDRIQSMQELEMRPALSRLDECLIRSTFGERDPDIHYRWASLWQVSDKDRADILKVKADAARTIAGTGGTSPPLMPIEALSEALVNSITEDGSLPGLEAAIDEFGVLAEQEDEPETMVAAVTPVAGEAPSNAPARMAANDAKPRTLYVRRDVLNRGDIERWAKAQGFSQIVPDLYVTVAYSRTPVDWFKVGTSWSDKVEIGAGGPRQMERLGADGKYIVLLITANELVWRHREIIEAGASWDWADYQPHISIQIGGDIDLEKVEPYQGRIVLGPEIFEELRAD